MILIGCEERQKQDIPRNRGGNGRSMGAANRRHTCLSYQST